MNEKLVEYMEQLFADVPVTKQAMDLKEELTQNLIDKYNDLLVEGKSPEVAYNIAIAGIGNVDALLQNLRAGQSASGVDVQKAKQRSAAFISVAVMLYILSVIPVILIQSEIGVVLMFLLIAVATGLIIFNAMTKPSRKQDRTLVDEYCQRQDENDPESRTRKAVSSAMWSLIVVVYLLVSFLTHRWDITWILFLIGVAAESILKAVFELRRK